MAGVKADGVNPACTSSWAKFWIEVCLFDLKVMQSGNSAVWNSKPVWHGLLMKEEVRVQEVKLPRRKEKLFGITSGAEHAEMAIVLSPCKSLMFIQSNLSTRVV